MSEGALRPRPEPRSSAEFPYFIEIPTRWMDNDVYGHVNNVVYYSFFDTAVNRMLTEQGLLDIHAGDVIGLVVETGCSYFRPLAFPERVRVGLGVDHIGTSSVRYRLGVFTGDQIGAAAQGHFVHVYVDRESRRPCPLDQRTRLILGRFQ